MTYASALPTLTKLAKSDKSRMHSDICGCRGQARFHPPAAQAAEVDDLDWSVCPLDLVDNPFAAQVQAIRNLADRGFPTDHSRLVAWAVIGLLQMPK